MTQMSEALYRAVEKKTGINIIPVFKNLSKRGLKRSLSQEAVNKVNSLIKSILVK